jgi:xanthine dehydrogenase accessory factor
MSDWLDTLLRLRETRTRAIVVTVASTRGSVPRGAGTKMIVTADDVYGTIGGGHLEHKAIAIARGELAAGRASDVPLRRFPLGASLGQCCGGLVNLMFETVVGDEAWLQALADVRRSGNSAVIVTAVDRIAATGKLVLTRDAVHGTLDPAVDAKVVALARAALADDSVARLAAIETDCHSRERVNPASFDEPHRTPASAGATNRTVFIDPLRATDFRIVLFGAGHVGRAIVRTLEDVPCRITWVDERESEFPRDVPGNVTIVCTDAPDAEVDAAPTGAYFLVMTHSHAIDEAISEKILRRGDYAYFGLIGSMTKRRAFEKRIERRGMPVERLATMTCPIGVAGIKGKEPAVIAIAVAAELLQVHARAADAEAVADASARRA